MILRFRRLSGSFHMLSVEPSDSIEHVKTLLAEQLSIPRDTLRLLFRGRPLTDDQTAASLDVGCDDFIIIMQTKKQVVINVPAASQPTALDPPAATRPPPPSPTPAPESPSSQPLPDPFLHRRAPETNSASDPPNFPDIIRQLTELGYNTEESEQAARVAGYNIERAASLLVAGSLRREEPKSLGPAELLFELLRGDGMTIPISTIEEIVQNANVESGLEDDLNEPDPEQDFTQEEKAQIDRLQELGFDRELVIRVYLMCDKDESVAANCLLTMHEEK
jgi:UV excision repair protein RAD23